jgi:hypothetical protein
MKISRFVAMTVFGLGLISQVAFSYAPKATDAKKMPKKECHRSAFPLFNEKENRTLICENKDEQTKTIDKKNVKSKPSHKATCGVGCHKSVLPLFNKEENRTCVCPDADKNMTDKTTKTMNNGLTKAVAKK